MSENKGIDKRSSTETVEEVSSFPVLDYRGYPQNVLNWFGAKAGYNPETGSVKYLYNPVHRSGELCGYIRRGEDKSFVAVGSCGINTDLLGQNLCKHSRRLYITEGFLDMVAAKSAISKLSKERNNPLWATYDVVSIGYGTTNAVSHVGYNIDFVKRYDEVVLMFDNDSKEDYNKPGIWGKEATQKVISLLGPETKVVSLPKRKDPDNVYREAGWEELAWLMVKADVWTPSGILVGGQLSVEEIFKPVEPGIYIDRFPETSKKLKGFRSSGIIVVSSFSGVGKSTFVSHIQWEIARHKKTGAIYLEEEVEKTHKRFIALELGVPLDDLETEKMNSVFKDRREEIDAAYNRIIAGNMVFKHQESEEGDLDPDNIIDCIRHMHLVQGCKVIFVDHIGMFTSGDGSSGDQKAGIDRFMHSLAAFERMNDVLIILVSHTKRVQYRPPRDPETGEKVYPHWKELEQEDLRGSASLEQYAHNIFTMGIEILKDGKGRTRIYQTKARIGDTGQCDTLQYNPRTGLLEIANDY